MNSDKRYASVKCSRPGHQEYLLLVCLETKCSQSPSRLLCKDCLQEHEKGHRIVSFQTFIDNPELDEVIYDELLVLQTSIDEFFDQLITEACRSPESRRSRMKALLCEVVQERKKFGRREKMEGVKELLLGGTRSDLDDFNEMLSKTLAALDEDQATRLKREQIERLKKNIGATMAEISPESVTRAIAGVFVSWGGDGTMTFASCAGGYTGITTRRMIPPFKATLRVNNNLDVLIGLVESFLPKTLNHNVENCTCHQRAVYCFPYKTYGFYAKEQSVRMLKRHSNPGVGVRIEIEVDADMNCTFYFNGSKELEYTLPLDFVPYIYAQVWDNQKQEVELIQLN
eukprot:TRINITY_DN570_c0_g2_i2.p1 TRINITY_DN570_c0_g2~~TRINITY_DN570_c0_g2_i2.p1  ORF type:complete len:342 (+),score=54.26 TRINITY_DN570_c0_g2_i2:242-1267(+)